MIDCSCNVISDKHFKKAIEDNRERLTEGSAKKAVGIVYHNARLLRDAEKHVIFRKPCRTCFQAVAQHIRDAGIPLEIDAAFLERQEPERCRSACGGCGKNDGACTKPAL